MPEQSGMRVLFSLNIKQIRQVKVQIRRSPLARYVKDICFHVALGESWKQSNDAYFSNIRKEGFSIWN